MLNRGTLLSFPLQGQSAVITKSRLPIISTPISLEAYGKEEHPLLAVLISSYHHSYISVKQESYLLRRPIISVHKRLPLPKHTVAAVVG